MVRKPPSVPAGLLLSPSPRSVDSVQKRPRIMSIEPEDAPLTESRCRQIVADELNRFKADLGDFLNYLVEDKIIRSISDLMDRVGKASWSKISDYVIPAPKQFYLQNLPGPSGKDIAFLEKLHSIRSEDVVHVCRRDWTCGLYQAIEAAVKPHFDDCDNLIQRSDPSIRKYMSTLKTTMYGPKGPLVCGQTAIKHLLESVQASLSKEDVDVEAIQEGILSVISEAQDAVIKFFNARPSRVSNRVRHSIDSLLFSAAEELGDLSSNGQMLCVLLDQLAETTKVTPTSKDVIEVFKESESDQATQRRQFLSSWGVRSSH